MFGKIIKGESYAKEKILTLLLAVTCVATMFTGCGDSTGTEKKEESSTKTETTSDHEAITIDAPYQNMSPFIDKVHEKYPEINIEVVPYCGSNTTAWVKAMLKADEMTDIYFTTFYSAQNEDVSDRLLDLSGYDFTDNYVQSRLREVTFNGCIYLLPLYYSCFGITYNKTLLEKTTQTRKLAQIKYFWYLMMNVLSAM